MTLAGVIRGFGKPKILVVGDLVLDRYVFGSVGRISQEAPIPIFTGEREETRLGCAGSAARDLAELGAEVRLCGHRGADARGEELEAIAMAAGIDVSGVVRVSERPTAEKTRFVALRGAGGQQVLRVDRERTDPYPAEGAAELCRAVLDRMDEADLVVVSDYAKGTLGADLVARLLDKGREKGVPVLVDPKPPAYRRYAGATALTPNRPEAASYAGFPVTDADSARRAAEKIRSDLDLDAAVVKLDGDGIFLAERGGLSAHFAVARKEVYDVTGAGDMVIAALAMAVACGASWPDAVRIANLAAGIEVSRLGVVPVSREEILEALHEEGALRPAAKLRSLDQVLEILAARRGRGETVVFTNGCFDLVHAGHIRLLTAARAEGDVLVVGLNSDASVRRLKGEGRPISSETERAEVLSSLAPVDHIVVFSDETPLELIRAIHPDVLVKGADWTEKGVVGRELVEGWGGRVVLVPLLEGRSSSRIIERIREEGET